MLDDRVLYIVNEINTSNYCKSVIHFVITNKIFNLHFDGARQDCHIAQASYCLLHVMQAVYKVSGQRLNWNKLHHEHHGAYYNISQS
jgi:hypothetical protein